MSLSTSIKISLLVFLFVKGVISYGQTQNVTPEVKALNEKAWSYIYQQPDSAKVWAQKAIDKAKQIDDPYSIGAATTRLAIAYDISGEFENALQFYFKSLNVLQPYAPSEELGFLYNNLSLCYYNFYDYEKALQYVKKAYENDRQLEDSSGMATALTNMGLFYGYLHFQDSALLAYDQSIKISGKTRDTVNLHSAISNKAKIIFQKGNYKQALAIYTDLAPLIQSTNAKVSWYISLAQTHSKLQHHSSALSYADSALQLATHHQLKERVLYALENYAEIAENAGQTDAAFEKYKSYIALKDSIFKNQMDERVANEEARYQLLAKEKEATEAQNQALEEQVQKETFYQYLITALGILLGVLLVTVFLIFYVRSQRKSNRLAREKLAQKELFIHEIHHRVKNNMQMITAMIDIQQAAVDEQSEPFLDQLKDRLATMAKTHQFLYERHDFQGIHLKDYFDELKSLFQDSTDQKIIFDFHIQSLILHVDTVIPIALILSEWITNSIKYAYKPDEEGKISIFIRQEGETLLIQYSDHGKGISTTREGFGSSMVRSLSRQLKAKISVDSSRGTTYTLEVKKFKRVEQD